jgi:competence protein ComEA
VNINTADAETISAELKGVGLTKARAIVEYRKKHGPFRSADDLSLVKGIGDRTVELNRSDIVVTKPGK